MTEIDKKYKNSYAEEYAALLEAVLADSSDAEDAVKCMNEYKEERFPPLPSSSAASGSDEQRRNSSSNDVERKREFPTKEEEERDLFSSHSGWSAIPDLVLEKIMSHLNVGDKYNASVVCQSWYRCFYYPGVWSNFVFNDRSMTRRLFNYYSGWQYMLDHLRAQYCLKNVGHLIRTLSFEPSTNFYNMYEFMNMISFYAEQRGIINDCCNQLKGVGSNIRTLIYTFPCSMSTKNDARLYGTGGKLLEALKRLMNNLPSLKRLELIDLMLDSEEASQLLDQVCYHHCSTLTRLKLINSSKMQCPLLHIGVFVNLKVLTVSPQSLGDEVVVLLGDTATLHHLRVVQNRYTSQALKAVSASAWNKCFTKNPRLKLHLEVDSVGKNTPLLWQPSPVVTTIAIKSTLVNTTHDMIYEIIDRYAKSLEMFGSMALPRFHQPKSFLDRIDSPLLYLCEKCSQLRILVIKERVSTSTLLLLTKKAEKLKLFKVRKNAVILRCDWPKAPEWSPEFYQWLKTTSQSYEATENAISLILGQKHWTFLTDKEFMRLDTNLYQNLP